MRTTSVLHSGCVKKKHCFVNEAHLRKSGCQHGECQQKSAVRSADLSVAHADNQACVEGLDAQSSAWPKSIDVGLAPTQRCSRAAEATAGQTVCVCSILVHGGARRLGGGLGLGLERGGDEGVQPLRLVADPTQLDLQRLVLGGVVLRVEDLGDLDDSLAASERAQVELLERRLGGILRLAHRGGEEAVREARGLNRIELRPVLSVAGEKHARTERPDVPVERVGVHLARDAIAEHVARNIAAVKVVVVGRLLPRVVHNLPRVGHQP
mmetsp:Transcript_25067/g.54742  ORF Transcript_25067/g.54742 Transcript_25067/m.54742 type:complete len:267 (-) Transcript_25067:321-1121(-)